MPKNISMDEEVTPAMRDALGLLTAPQVAKLLQVSKDWVYDQVAENAIPFVRIGRNVRFRPADIEAYLAGTWSKAG